jgi:5-methylcytosine-specific restriction endonuclease McrA
MQSFYSSQAWRNLRAKVKAKWRATGKPCAYCGLPIDWRNQKTIADHVKPVRAAPHLKLDESNIVVMHHSCHTRKTICNDYAQGVVINIDGYADDDWR